MLSANAFIFSHGQFLDFAVRLPVTQTDVSSNTTWFLIILTKLKTLELSGARVLCALKLYMDIAVYHSRSVIIAATLDRLCPGRSTDHKSATHQLIKDRRSN